MRVISNLSSGLLLAASLSAQTVGHCELECDINNLKYAIGSGPAIARTGAGGTVAKGFIKCGSSWFFFAATQKEYGELWKTDGTPGGTVLVKDIHPSGNSDVSWLTCCKIKGRDVLFFRANDGTHGPELWLSNGTALGTLMVKDIRPGWGGSFPRHLECMGGRVYFQADDGVAGAELWCSDGTAAGTVLVRDIFRASGSTPIYLKRNTAGTEIYFQANDGTNGQELWKTGGTAATTVLVKDIWPGTDSSAPSEFVNHAGKTLFRASDVTNGSELWSTDGTAPGTVLLKDIWPGKWSSSPVLKYSNGAVIGNDLLFEADGYPYGRELWKTDGTTAGTVLVKDISLFSSRPRHFCQLSPSTVVFAALRDPEGYELWRTDGTAAGTVLVKDIHPSGSSLRSGFANLGSGKVVFEADDGTNGHELWISDGTARGTKLLKNINATPGNTGSNPQALTPLPGGRVLFSANDPATGRELWTTAGTAATTILFKDIEPAVYTRNAAVDQLTGCFGSTMIFSATDGKSGLEPFLWKNGRCVRLKDISAGSSSSSPGGFKCCWTGPGRPRYFFAAWTAGGGAEPWISDGTWLGTQMLADLCMNGSSFPSDFTCCNNMVYFSAYVHRAAGAELGRELVVADGTPDGTTIIDIQPNSRGSMPGGFICCQGKIYFSADDGTSGHELWVSDGTRAGTKMVMDINQGFRGSNPRDLTCCLDRKGNATIYFSAETSGVGGVGAELWKSDGTSRGTVLVKDIRSGTASSRPRDFECCFGKLLFRANDGKTGDELWSSDGTANGTSRVKDIFPGPGSSSPSELTCCTDSRGRETLYFRATLDGTELWKSDGTEHGTVLVKDIYAGPGSSRPACFASFGDRVYFSARTPDHGRELWCSDGTAAGTMEVCDIYPGSDWSDPRGLTRCGGRLYFHAYDLSIGRELWVIKEPGATVERVGQGCAPTFPTLNSTPWCLGSTPRISGVGGPQGHVGVIVWGTKLDKPYDLFPPISRGCCGFVDLFGVGSPRGSGALWPAGFVHGSTWSFSIGKLPNDRNLLDVCFSLQTWWLKIPSVLPLVTTNGLVIGVGL